MVSVCCHKACDHSRRECSRKNGNGNALFVRAVNLKLDRRNINRQAHCALAIIAVFVGCAPCSRRGQCLASGGNLLTAQRGGKSANLRAA